MTQEAIKKQALELEEKLWNIAEKLGMKKTREITERLRKIIIEGAELEHREHWLAAGIAFARISHSHPDNSDGAWKILCEGYYCAGVLAEMTDQKPDSEIIRSILSMQGRNGAIAKLANDPKQTAKKFVKDCWLTWQEEPERYKGKTAFAKDMLKQEQCKSLESQVKIVRWCGEWEKAHSTG